MSLFVTMIIKIDKRVKRSEVLTPFLLVSPSCHYSSLFIHRSWAEEGLTVDGDRPCRGKPSLQRLNTVDVKYSEAFSSLKCTQQRQQTEDKKTMCHGRRGECG